MLKFAACIAWFSTCLAAPPNLAAQHPKPTAIRSAGNPILSDGSLYSADPAPIGRHTTQCLRAVFNASGDDDRHATIAVQEWEALAPTTISLTQLRTLTPTDSAPTPCSTSRATIDTTNTAK